MLTKRGFYLIVFLTYIVIAGIAGYLFYSKFDLTTILSFLGVTISPSAPAFLAIFLSQYSVQSEDAKKGERLKDIQIKKELSVALTNHYKIVRQELSELPNKMDASVKSAGSISVLLEGLNMKLINDPFDSSIEKAMLHFIAEASPPSKVSLDDFKKSEANVNTVNAELGEQKIKTIKFLTCSNHKATILVTETYKQRNGNQAVIYGDDVFNAAYRIWNDDKKYNNTISELNKVITGPTPSGSIQIGDLSIDQQEIKWNGTSLASTDSFNSGVDVLGLILKLLQNKDIQAKCKNLELQRREICKLRDEFSEKINEIIKKIDRNELLEVTDCCPFHEYKEDIISYFKKSGLYAIE